MLRFHPIASAKAAETYYSKSDGGYYLANDDLRREWVERLHPIGVGWNSVVGAREFGKIDFTLKPHAGRWESGTLNVGGIHALGASLELLLGLGIENVAGRVLELTTYLCERAAAAGLEVFSSRAAAERAGIVSLVPRAGSDPRALMRRCRDEGIVINMRAGRARCSCIAAEDRGPPHLCCCNRREPISGMQPKPSPRERPWASTSTAGTR